MLKQTSLTSFYFILATAFCVIVVTSNIISAKLFRIPYFESFSIPAGLITYPFTFLISDLVTEIYGAKKSKLMVYTALGMAILSFSIIQIALLLPSQDSLHQQAFHSVLGLNGLIIFASLIAYIISQLLDIQVYTWIKSLTGPHFLWLRNNGSTLLSQIVDTLTVNLIHLYWGLGMEIESVLQIMIFSYLYKATFSLANTPLFYVCVFLIKEGKTELNFSVFRYFKFAKQA